MWKKSDAQSVAPSVEEIDAQNAASVEEIDTQSVA